MWVVPPFNNTLRITNPTAPTSCIPAQTTAANQPVGGIKGGSSPLAISGAFLPAA
jgi:hypothetical protein